MFEIQDETGVIHKIHNPSLIAALEQVADSINTKNLEFVTRYLSAKVGDEWLRYEVACTPITHHVYTIAKYDVSYVSEKKEISAYGDELVHLRCPTCGHNFYHEHCYRYLGCPQCGMVYELVKDFTLKPSRKAAQ